MKIWVKQLAIRARQGMYEINFAAINFFYGKTGAGKSTIPRLIDFCLGNELLETPTLQKELLSVQLILQIGDHHVILEREKGSNQIIASYKKHTLNNELYSLIVPIYGHKGVSIIPDAHVENISDFIFYLAGLEAPYVRRSKTKEDTAFIRLSFRDLMWYCYLRQDEIDSSFFFLGREENIFKQNKSRDVMRFMLGYHRERVSELENQLAEVRQKQSSLLDSAQQLRSILKEYGIQDTEVIRKEISELDTELKGVKKSIAAIEEGIAPKKQHAVDDLKNEARSIANLIDELESGIANYSFRISEQKKLKNQYLTSSIRTKRTSVANEVLKDVEFETCPQCGNNVKNRVVSSDNCTLCNQPINYDLVPKSVRDADLVARITELDESIARLKEEQNQLQLKVSALRNEKALLDEKLQEAESQYDSIFLSQAKQLESKRGIIEGKIHALYRLLPFPEKAKQLEEESHKLGAEKDRIQKELSQAREEAERDNTNLADLASLFLDTLKKVKFPSISENDTVKISPSDFIPHIIREGDELFLIDFSNLGSGGKKTIFKACFSVAIHRLAARMNISLPTILIIDTPMKNISERENTEIFQSFYQLIYELASAEFKGRQLILIDKEYYAPDKRYNDLDIFVRHMSPDDPLIPYYRGH